MPFVAHIVRWCAPVITALVLAACALTTDDTSGCIESRHGVEICDGRDNNCDGKVDEMAACPTEMVCTAGACTCSKTTCGDPPACVDTSIDTSNCGSCGHACKPAENCVDGACKCQLPGGLKCGGKCIDLGTDPKNCGACNHVCTVDGSICDAGVCECPQGMIECDAKCINPSNDRHNCGTCGTTCDVACSGAKCATIEQVVAGGSHSCA